MAVLEPDSVDPTLVTAADYETHIRPVIAALEAEVERLREAAIRSIMYADPRLDRVRAEVNLDREIEALRAAREWEVDHG